ncbi:unnamed protein product [Leptosia nina]|uniref:Uncharacterized protein n=1 Tax=Leptosia nina TaxID=320188 RepID=A0AAV1JUW7_9NEOP
MHKNTRQFCAAIRSGRAHDGNYDERGSSIRKVNQEIREWTLIATKSDAEVKLAWKKMKLSAKANLSTHKQQLISTGEEPKLPSQIVLVSSYI